MPTYLKPSPIRTLALTHIGAIGIQTRPLGIPGIYLADSYIALVELLLCNRIRDTRYGIEKIVTSRITPTK